MSPFERIVRVATRRPLLTVAIVVLLALAGGVAALGLEPDTDPDTFASRSSESYQATDRLQRRFGDDAVVVLVRGDLQRVMLTEDLARLVGLEGCLSGNAPQGADMPGGRDGPCAKLARSRPVQVVYGPGTFVNEAVGQIQAQFQTRQQAQTRAANRAAAQARRKARQQGLGAEEVKRAGDAARQAVYTRFLRDLTRLAVRYGIRDLPRIDDPGFVSQLVFDPARGYNHPKARFAYLFPNARSALIQVRLKAGLDQAQRREAIELVRAATEMPDWRLARSGATYTVSGGGVLLSDLTTHLTDAIVVLLIAALLVMALVLALVFRTRLRLLPLAVALAAVGLTFGGMALFGVSLTMASIAVLPILIGLAVDYAIQLQARYREARDEGPPPGEAADPAAAARSAAIQAARVGGPTVATAAAATVAGFLVLQISPVPMVRGFGLLLVAGIVIALAIALTAGFAALVLAERGVRLPRPLRGIADALAPSARGAGELLGACARAVGRLLRAIPPLRWIVSAVRRGGEGAFQLALRRPGRVLAVAFVLAAAGWIVDTQTEVVSDVTKLVPQDSRALRDLDKLQRATGVAGVVTVVVDGKDVTDPRTIAWMGEYQREILRRYGYSETRGCGKAALCPGASLPDLFRGVAANADRKEVKAILDAVPPYFSQAVVTPDRRTAAMTFGIKLLPLDQQQRIVEDMRKRLDPPPGVQARIGGLPVITAEANEGVSSDSRRLLTLVAGLLAVLAVLLLIFRAPRRAVIPLVPIALATGWSALLLFAVRIPLNPMSVTLGALVIAISTEFSVLLSERYRQERARGHEPAEALRRTYRSTGAAVLASGTTAVAGFAVLVLSDIRMLRDFGAVTVVDLSVSLLGVMIVLPAVIVIAERRRKAA